MLQPTCCSVSMGRNEARFPTDLCPTSLHIAAPTSAINPSLLLQLHLTHTHTTSQQYPSVFPRSLTYHILTSPLCPQYSRLQRALSSRYMRYAISTICHHQWFGAMHEEPAQPAVALGCWESQAERLWAEPSLPVLQHVSAFRPAPHFPKDSRSTIYLKPDVLCQMWLKCSCQFKRY